MFDNIDEYYLWDIQPSVVKSRDENTDKITYEGKERGQTQRYLIGIGRLIEFIYNKTAELYVFNNSEDMPESIFEFRLTQENLNFLNSLDESVVRDIIKNYAFNKKSKGSETFFKWMVWKVLGWETLSISKELPENTLKVWDTGESSFLYDETEALNYVLFDGSAVLTIALLVDPSGTDIEQKKAWLEIMVKEWLLNGSIEYS